MTSDPVPADAQQVVLTVLTSIDLAAVVVSALRDAGLLVGPGEVERYAVQVSAMYAFADELEAAPVGRFFAEEIRNRLAAARLDGQP